MYNKHTNFYFIFKAVDNGNPQYNYFILNTINIVSFFVVNFAFLFLMLNSVWKIRHIRDRLDIKQEMTYIVGFWSFYSLLQYLGFFVD